LIVAAVAASACGGARPGRTSPADPFASIPIAALPTPALAGDPTLLLTVGALIVGDSASALPELEARRTALLGAAYAALDTVLRRDAREIRWLGLDEQERAARRSPTLNLSPERLPTAYLVGERVEVVPDPMRAELRTLAGLTGCRLAVAPAAARIAGSAGAYVATYVLAVVDTRIGRVVWRGRVVGPAAATPEAAFAAAAGTALATLH
jgi:hypothetical protein